MPVFSVSGLSVLYVTDRQDAPFRYRCLHPCLRLRAAGIRADLMHVRDERLPSVASRYSVVVLFRLPWSTGTRHLVETAKSAGAKLVFDVDDLVFDPAALSDMPFMAGASPIVRKQYERTAARLGQTLEACDQFVGSTPALARAVQRLGKPAFVYPNLLHPAVLKASGRIQDLRGWMQRRPIITYMSGSLTHNEDFATIAPVLERILRERPDALLMIGGFLETTPNLTSFSDRIIRLPFQDWRVQPWSMNLARVNLAPLAVVNEFTHAKSAIKFHEAGVIGLPTVATLTEPLREAIRAGQNGFLAESSEQWYEAIVTCLDMEVSRRIGDEARAGILAYHGEYQTTRLIDFLASLGGQEGRSIVPPLTKPTENADPTSAPGPVRRWLLRAARARAVLGILRRAGDPSTLSRPDLCRAVHATHEKVELDPPLVDLNTAMASGAAQEPRIALNGRWLGQRLSEPSRTGRGAKSWRRWDGRSLVIQEPCPAIAPANFAALLVVMAVRADHDDAFARFSWSCPNSLSGAAFPILCDGLVHSYLVDLVHRGWPRSERAIQDLRFEPLTRPGEFCLEQLVLLTVDGFRGVAAGSAGR